MKFLLSAALLLAFAVPARAQAPSFRSLFQALIETDTTPESGGCAVASARMAQAMTGAEFPSSGLHSYAAKQAPQDGGLVAILPGRDPRARALLLVAHIDVVPADRANWRTDPFKLTERDGYFHGRGVADNKVMAAALVDLLIRLHAEGFKPRRDIKVALTCGEETPTAFNGAEYLANERRDLIQAGLALVPTGGAARGARGMSISIQAGEKTQQNFRLEATGTPSHASRPMPDNAIYTLAAALTRLAGHRFPVRLNDATRRYFATLATTAPPVEAAGIRALLASPGDRAAQDAVTRDPAWNGMLRTTCAATVIETGGQANTVAARAAANVNCRLLPGDQVADVQGVLSGLVEGLPVSVSSVPPLARPAPSPPVTARLATPIERAAAKVWPGVAIVPTMLTGATDARHFNAVGIATYGLTVFPFDDDGNGVHAPNERIGVQSVEEGRMFLERLVRSLADAAEL